MKLDPLFKTLQNCYTKKKPFVVYAQPDSTEITGLFQRSRTVHRFEGFTEDGFILSPFQKEEGRYFIPNAQCEILRTQVMQLASKEGVINLPEDPEVHKIYLQLLERTIEEIRARGLKKIVISRKRNIVLKDFSIISLLLTLFSEYPTAFRYLWYHPETGIWCGASPEVLLKVNDHNYKTMSLAGTQKCVTGDTPNWTEKERKEQQYVTEGIETALKPHSVTMKVSETSTHRAGTLAHLRTDISGEFREGISLNQVLSDLHPTPAVCGSPRDAGFDFILKNEGYDREFYTGFMGPVGKSQSTTALFVNLRCMRIAKEKATIYVGGGITNQSQPEAEWEETCHKQQTMLKVLREFL